MIGSAILRALLVLFLSSGATAVAQDLIKVSSVAELRAAMEGSGQTIKMKPGAYEMGGRSFNLSGNNNTVDLTGADFSWVVGEVGRGE